MSAKQDRQGARTAADLERRWNFGESFAEVMGIATDARKAAEEATKVAVGTNILTGTKDFSGGNWVNISLWPNAGEYRGLTVLTHLGAWQGVRQYISCTVGETYTISAYVKSSGDFQFHHNMGGSGTGAATPVAKAYGPITEWTRISDTFTVTQAGEIAPGYEGSTDATQLWICGMKIEKGDKATDWSPAPVDNALTHESVFNALTNNGALQGIYRGDDGEIYINARYIASGTIVADMVRTGQLVSEDGLLSIDLDTATLRAISGTGKREMFLSAGALVGYGYDMQNGTKFRSFVIQPGYIDEYGNVTTAQLFSDASSVSLSAAPGKILSLGNTTHEVRLSGKTVSWKDNGDGTYTLVGR